MLLGGVGTVILAIIALLVPNVGDPPPALFAPGSSVWAWIGGATGVLQLAGAANLVARRRWPLVLAAAVVPVVLAVILTWENASAWSYLALEAVALAAIIPCRHEFAKGP